MLSLHSAEPPVLRREPFKLVHDIPPIAPDSLKRREKPIGVNLVLHFEEFLVLFSIEGLLDVRLRHIRLRGQNNSAVALEEIDVLELMRPGGEGAGTGRLAVEVVPCVLNDEPDIGPARKVDGDLNVCNIGGINDIGREATQGTVIVTVGGSLAGKAYGHHRHQNCRSMPLL